MAMIFPNTSVPASDAGLVAAVGGDTAVALVLSPQGGYELHMSEPHIHSTHPALVTRLKRAEGHLRHVIGMLEAGKPCADIAIQMQAVEHAVTAAKRALIHDHMDHCLGNGDANDLSEMRALAKLL